jgi:hypothetical protein
VASEAGNDREYYVSPAEKRLGWASIYTLNGWFTVPVPRRRKGPILKKWQELRITEDQLQEYFQGDGNIGVLLGDVSRGLTDVDLDAKEALAAADIFLPQTPMISGRQGKPKSHRWYIPFPTPAGTKFKDPLIEDSTKATLVELRSNTKKKDGALQTVVPPSLHKETGEPIQWEAFTLDPARVPAPQLINAVTHVAVCALVARYWPDRGEHGHDVVLALSGALLRAGLDLEVVKKIVLTSARIAGYPRAKDADVEDTASNLSEGKRVTGWPRLAELMPEEVVDQVWEWLGKPSRLESPEVEGGVSAEAQAAADHLNLAPWPELSPAAYHGLAGDFVRLVEPHSEADPAALLGQFLTMFGNVVGRGPHCLAEADEHFTNIFVVFVGASAKARKGTSYGRVRDLFARVAEEWALERIRGGLSSGEGLIFQVRDPDKKDEGVDDKRLLLFEPEFALVLKVISRDGNTLTSIIRQAWDSGTLRTMPKSTLSATGAHISIIGHITVEELRRYITETELASGFANRFDWLCVRRSKCLPNDEDRLIPKDKLLEIVERLRGALSFA